MRKLRMILACAVGLTFIAGGAAPLLAQSDAARLQGIQSDLPRAYVADTTS